jgi:hypothetical protein
MSHKCHCDKGCISKILTIEKIIPQLEQVCSYIPLGKADDYTKIFTNNVIDQLKLLLIILKKSLCFSISVDLTFSQLISSIKIMLNSFSRPLKSQPVKLLEINSQIDIISNQIAQLISVIDFEKKLKLIDKKNNDKCSTDKNKKTDSNIGIFICKNQSVGSK